MTNQKRLTHFAKVTSLVFSPLIWVSGGVFRLIWSAIARGELTFSQAEVLLATFLGGPILFFLIQVKRGEYDLDISKREKRFSFYLVSLGFGFLGLNLLYLYSLSLFRYFLALLLVGFVFMLTTFWDKVSLHTGTLMSWYLAYNLTHSWRLFFTFPLIVLVAWSRVQLKSHSFAEILEAFLIPLVVLPAAFYLMGIRSF